MIRDMIEMISKIEHDLDSGFWQYEYAKKAKAANEEVDAKYHIGEATDYHKQAADGIAHTEALPEDSADIKELTEFMLDREKERLHALENKIKNFTV